MKSKAAILYLALMAGLTLTLTACGSTDTESASSAIEAIASVETSETLGLYLQDTDGDGIFDTVVDRYGVALGEQYHIEADGIYKDETLFITIENAQVYIPVEKITFTIESKTVHPGTEFTLDVVFLPEDATCMEYDLTVDNADVLQIENDTITALNNGEATVTAAAKAGGATATCLITVNAEATETEEQNEQVPAANNNSGGTATNTTTKGGDNNGALNTPPNYGNQNTGGGTNNTNTQPQNNNNQQTGGNSTTNTSGGNAVQQVPPTTPQPQVHIPIYKQQWVVDKAAWTESVPVHQTVELSICNYCSADITSNPNKHLYDHALNGIATGWHSEFSKIQIGTQTVNHPEEGHWESVLVCSGCTGTH